VLNVGRLVLRLILLIVTEFSAKDRKGEKNISQDLVLVTLLPIRAQLLMICALSGNDTYRICVKCPRVNLETHFLVLIGIDATNKKEINLST
jgi:hypothetical protein